MNSAGNARVRDCCLCSNASLVCGLYETMKLLGEVRCGGTVLMRVVCPGHLAAVHWRARGGLQEHQDHRGVPRRRAHQCCQGEHTCGTLWVTQVMSYGRLISYLYYAQSVAERERILARNVALLTSSSLLAVNWA